MPDIIEQLEFEPNEIQEIQENKKEFFHQSLRKKHSAIPVKKSSVRSRIFVRDVITGKILVRPLRVKVSENLGATTVAPVTPEVTSLR